jgi:hypothetical protein
MEPYMQQQAILAIVLGAIVITGSAVTLALGPRLRTRPLPGGINRWQLESVPLAVTGGLLALSARAGGGQSSRTHAIVLAVAIALFASALLCAVAGAAISTRHQRAAHQRATQQQAAQQ